MEPPKKKTEAIDAHDAYTPGYVRDAIEDDAADYGKRRYNEGVAAERERILGGLEREAAELWLHAEDEADEEWAAKIRDLARKLRKEGAA